MTMRAECHTPPPSTTEVRSFGVGHRVRRNPALPARGRSIHPDSPFAMRGAVSGEGRCVLSEKKMLNNGARRLQSKKPRFRKCLHCSRPSMYRTSNESGTDDNSGEIWWISCGVPNSQRRGERFSYEHESL